MKYYRLHKGEYQEINALQFGILNQTNKTIFGASYVLIDQVVNGSPAMVSIHPNELRLGQPQPKGKETFPACRESGKCKGICALCYELI